MALCLITSLGTGLNGLFAGNNGDGGEYYSNSMLSSESALILSPSYFMDMGSDEMFTDFELYPNPSTGVFNLNFKTDMRGTTSLTIYNLLGKQIHTEDLENFKGAFKGSFDLGSYPSGFYFLQVRIGKEVYQHKLVLSRQ